MAPGVTQLARLGYIVNDPALVEKGHWQIYLATYTYLVVHLLTPKCLLLLSGTLYSIKAFLTPLGHAIYTPLRFLSCTRKACLLQKPYLRGSGHICQIGYNTLHNLTCPAEHLEVKTLLAIHSFQK